VAPAPRGFWGLEKNMVLLNSFSLNMLAYMPASIKVTEISLLEAIEIFADGIDSAVGHIDTAAVLGGQLGMLVSANRVTVALKEGDVAVVGQYRGPRLPEGCTVLPEGSTIQWLLVEVGS